MTGDTASDEWGTLGVWGPGTDPADPVSFWNPGINLLVRSNGEWYLAVNGSIVTHDRVDAADEYLLDVMAAESHYSARINGQAIDVNGALPGTTLDLTPYLPGLGSSDYITLGAYVNGGAGYRQTTFDDLMVSEIPEPATWLLLACGAGCAVLPALIRRRAARRK